MVGKMTVAWLGSKREEPDHSDQDGDVVFGECRFFGIRDKKPDTGGIG
jgi:hypothetical protein